MLKGQPGETSQKLLYIAEEKGRLAAEEKELMEAEHAAQNAISSLNQLMETLKSADNWGKVDILGGGLNNNCYQTLQDRGCKGADCCCTEKSKQPAERTWGYKKN